MAGDDLETYAPGMRKEVAHTVSTGQVTVRLFNHIKLAPWLLCRRSAMSRQGGREGDAVRPHAEAGGATGLPEGYPVHALGTVSGAGRDIQGTSAVT